MARTQPFFRHVAHVTGLMAPAPEPERYAYHDNDACPVGLEIKASGEWQYYEPKLKEETRPRCPQCRALDA
ncbi:hypothetical protein MON38_21035 [Hymenobacter sp. DH14]|jgi:hypothetical protein|uniref:Uncharacterized protein n=1 Tax=Hymenobacter cyanobacteriorum TaxID=2926463 RepID=A0A9X1VJB2_9BACT|nr:hypothetical protein [Hymenobacter cyanobacteriorum]MCI1189916.1 hypothetical protein [Hymenobacter cyanobacteriorum]